MKRTQGGFTLVELMVALVVGLLVTLAATAALLVARQGFTAVDAGSQLRENARFAADLMQRIVVQAGYVDVANGRWGREPSSSGSAYDDGAYPGVTGFDDSYFQTADATDLSVLADGNRTTRCTVADTSCANASDILIVRFQGASDPVSGTADGSMINCAGLPEAYVDDTEPNRAYSMFHVVRMSDGEPALACTYFDRTASKFVTQTLVRGVEGFQVLYGTDGVTPKTAPPALSNGRDGAVDRYLTAKELLVGGSRTSVDTINNWRRVKSVRITLLFRGDVGSAPSRVAKPWSMRAAEANPTLFLKNTDDPQGNSLGAPADGRMRTSMIFTVFLRNQQGFNVCTTTTVPACP